MSAAFECELLERGFALDAEDIECGHRADIAVYIQCYEWGGRPEDEHKYYLQRHFSWSKRTGCRDCIEGMVSNLEHGGHVDNLRAFAIDDGADISGVLFSEAFRPSPLDPDAAVRDAEE